MERGGKISRIRLAKELFLLKNCDSDGKLDFLYEFFPYKHGPYSATAFKDARKLSERGWILEGERTVEIPSGQRRRATEEIRELPGSTKAALTGHTNRFANFSDEKLVDFVYKEHPEYTALSVRSGPKPRRAKARDGIYTVGYEGVDLDGLLNKLIQVGIRCLVDVRYNPVSRAWGFSKKQLSEWCANIGVQYVHLPELGVPGTARKGITNTATRSRLLKDYEENYLPAREQNLNRLESIVTSMSSALMCLERDHLQCHRSRLARHLATKTGLPVINL